jgi:hypothetical protein
LNARHAAHVESKAKMQIICFFVTPVTEDSIWSAVTHHFPECLKGCGFAKSADQRKREENYFMRKLHK